MGRKGEREKARREHGVGQIAAVCVLIALAFLFALVLFIRTNIQIASGYAENSSDFFASDVSRSMVSLMESQCSFMRTRTYDNEFVNLIAKEQERGAEAIQKDCTAMLEKLVVSPSLSSAFLISCQSGHMFGSDGSVEAASDLPGIETWYRRMRNTSGNRMAVVTGSSGGLNAYFISWNEEGIPAVYVGRPLFSNETSKLVAVLGVRVFGAGMQTIMRTVQETHGQSAYCITADGEVIFSSDRGIVSGTPIDEVYPAVSGLVGELGNDPSAKDVVSEWTGLDLLIPLNQCLYQMRWREDFGCYLLTANHAEQLFNNVRSQVYTNIVVLVGLVALVVALVVVTLRWFRARLLSMAHTDELTGLPNRKSFGNKFDRQLAHGDLNNAALALVDVDLFKHVNDTYGHAVGDVALQLVADMIRTCVGEEGFAARWGGDEFICVLRMPVSEANKRLKNMVEGVHNLKIADGPQLTVSVGSTSINANLQLNRIIEQADAALYLVKNQGRDGIKTYEDGITIAELGAFEPAMANGHA